jgi:hypothetical protein
VAAEKLNNKAAEEIFRLRNSSNDIWKIDMHGLHASEAVAVLARHLYMIEFQQPGNNSTSTEDLAKLEAAYSKSTTGSNVELTAEKVVLRRPKQAILHVITGIMLFLYALLAIAYRWWFHSKALTVYIHKIFLPLSLEL